MSGFEYRLPWRKAEDLDPLLAILRGTSDGWQSYRERKAGGHY